jgi:hypothetical protein
LGNLRLNVHLAAALAGCGKTNAYADTYIEAYMKQTGVMGLLGARWINTDVRRCKE